jgi:hypothetical protein
VYYDLLKHRDANNLADTAIVRVEQLYPLHTDKLKAILKKFKKAKTFVWCQEEPENMGAATFIRPRLAEVIGKPVGPRKGPKPQLTSLTVQAGGDPVVAKTPSPVVPRQPEPTIESAHRVTEKLPDPQAVTQPHPASPAPARPLTWWDHVKNFGKRMWKGAKGLFGW